MFEVRAAIGEDTLAGAPAQALKTQLAASAAQMVQQSSAEVAQRIASHAEAALQFEDERLLAQARDIVPVEMLKQRARGALRNTRFLDHRRSRRCRLVFVISMRPRASCTVT
jgi:hypothetical protein